MKLYKQYKLLIEATTSNIYKLNEDKDFPTTGKQIEKLMDKYLNTNNLSSREKRVNDHSVNYTFKNDKIENNYFVSYNPNVASNGISVILESIIEISSISLADPKAVYLTTTARKVKTKKIRTKNLATTEKELIDLFKKHKNKIEKLS